MMVVLKNFLRCSLILSISLTLTAFSLPLQVSAEELGCSNARYRNLQIAIIDCNTQCSGAGCTCSLPTNLAGSDNPEKAFRFFVSKGLSPMHAAGVLGNLMQESGVNPEAVQGGGLTKDPATVGGKGWGIMQWTPGSKILNIATTANVTTPIHELGTQLEIVWWHMNNTSPTGAKKVIDGFVATTTVETATLYFEEKMEAAGKPNMPRRYEFARDALALYGENTATVATAPTGSATCKAGGATQYLEGFAVYSQYDPEWKDIAYGTSTIAASGCGPAAMAMIITALKGEVVTPPATSRVADENGIYKAGVGSSWNIGPVLASQWGLKSEAVAKDLGAVTAALQAGKLIIMPGEGSKPFTSEGHFIVIRGITPDGKFRIADSGHNDTSDKDWDPAQIMSSARDGGIYAIYK